MKPTVYPFRYLSAALLVFLVIGCVHGNAQEQDPIGMKAPEILAELWFNTDRTPSLAELQGQFVVVEFWPTWCKPCLKYSQHLNELHEKYADKGVSIIGLTYEDPAIVKPFLQQKTMKYIVGAGSPSSKAYGVNGIPHAFLIDPKGTIIWDGPWEGEPTLEETLEEQLKLKLQLEILNWEAYSCTITIENRACSVTTSSRIVSSTVIRTGNISNEEYAALVRQLEATGFFDITDFKAVYPYSRANTYNLYVKLDGRENKLEYFPTNHEGLDALTETIKNITRGDTGWN